MRIPRIKFSREDFDRLFKTALSYADEHKPAILAGIGLGFSYMATIKASKAGVEAKERIDDAKRVRSRTDPDRVFTKVDEFKAGAPAYIETVLWSAGSTFCIIKSTKVARSRELAAWGAYKVVQESYQSYKETIKENLGPKKADTIASKADAKLVEDISEESLEELQGGGTTLCIDAMSGRFFKTSIDRIKRAEAVINQRLYEEVYVCLNEFYQEIGIDENDMGNLIGWNNADCPIRIDISTQLTPKGEPCLVIRSDTLTTKYMYI